MGNAQRTYPLAPSEEDLNDKEKTTKLRHEVLDELTALSQELGMGYEQDEESQPPKRPDTEALIAESIETHHNTLKKLAQK